ncbi:MAG: hypothetical protein FJ396_08495 [Verrucomicrobia bacterium]|nr:hypothetical protein [Verrucomicrobiota bacterium]
MTLHQLFLADLGPELELTGETLRQACFAVRRNRNDWLLRQRTRGVIEMVAHTAEQWLEPVNGFRALALRDGPKETGWNQATLARGLDAFFGSITVESLEALVAQDLGDTRRLDDFGAGSAEHRTGRTSLAVGPELLVHLTAGNLPNPALFSMILGLVTRSAQVVKCPRDASFLPRLFAHSLAATESKLGACLELVSWSHDERGAPALEDLLFAEADCVTATGSDAMLAGVRPRIPAKTRFVAHGHRLSFGLIAKESLSPYSRKRLVRAMADDITAWNQLGCLSPHAYYVEEEASGSTETLAEELAAELERREASEPRGPLGIAESALIRSRRSTFELRSAAVASLTDRNLNRSLFFEPPATVRLWASPDSTAWTVVLNHDARLQPSCLHRFIEIKPVRQWDEVLRFAEPHRHQVSTVAVAAPDDRLPDIARRLARWGAGRICPIGRMQEPPAAWRHDGRPALGDLVTWTDLES